MRFDPTSVNTRASEKMCFELFWRNCGTKRKLIDAKSEVPRQESSIQSGCLRSGRLRVVLPIITSNFVRDRYVFVSCGIPAGQDALPVFRTIGNGPVNPSRHSTGHPHHASLSGIYEEDEEGVLTYPMDGDEGGDGEGGFGNAAKRARGSYEGVTDAEVSCFF